MSQPDPFDPHNLCGPAIDLAALQQRPAKGPPRHRPGEAFLMGPIPWLWLVKSAQLPGKALQVAMLLWREAGCRKSQTVSFCLSHGRQLGMGKDTTRRALRQLIGAGLVRVQGPPGRSLKATLLELTREGPQSCFVPSLQTATPCRG
jgi:hypothetical protein